MSASRRMSLRIRRSTRPQISRSWLGALITLVRSGWRREKASSCLISFSPRWAASRTEFTSCLIFSFSPA
jgi:hypothetical protein